MLHGHYGPPSDLTDLRYRLALTIAPDTSSATLHAREIELWTEALSTFALGYYRLHPDGSVNIDAATQGLRDWLCRDRNMAFLDLIGCREDLGESDLETLMGVVRKVYDARPGINLSGSGQALQCFTRHFIAQSELEMVRHEIDSAHLEDDMEMSRCQVTRRPA